MSKNVWAGIDAGKIAHHWVVIDDAGDKLLSRKVSNDEIEVLQLISEVMALAGGGRILWATDLNAGGAALLIAVFFEHEQELLYIPGRTVHHASAAYRGAGKTDAKDAAVIADQARMRRDLHPLRHRDETTLALSMLCARRTDLSAGRTRAINRLRSQLLEHFPALERAFDYAYRRGALILLARFRTRKPSAKAGSELITAWLRKHCAYRSDVIAAQAITAAQSQHTVVPGQQTGAAIAEKLARQVMALDGELDDIEQTITEVFRGHPYGPAIESVPGFGPLLGAELVAVINGNLGNYESPPTGSQPLPNWPRFHMIPGGSAATSKDRVGTTDACSSRATWLPTTASRPARPHARSTTANEPRANTTTKPSWHWPDAESTCCGPSFATRPFSSRPNGRLLDKTIETHCDGSA